MIVSTQININSQTVQETSLYAEPVETPGKRPNEKPEIEPDHLPDEQPGIQPDTRPEEEREDDDDEDDDEPYTDIEIGDDPDEIRKRTTIM